MTCSTIRLTRKKSRYQGVWDFASFKDLFGIDDAYFTPEFIELNKAANMMKAGCVFADRISTVSPTYAEEIRTPEYSEGLEGILNARSAQLNGILNGIDIDVFNPAKNSALAENYSKNDLSKKAECKKSLQQKLGLNVDDSVPILSMVTRMTEQKGFELVMTILDDLMQKENVQFVLLGSGDSRYESFMREAEQRWKGRLCAYIGYNEDLAHHVYSGSDYFLMPSRFEPCGLGQMIAMRYGALPIVRETGGLKDSVTPYNCETGEGNGFSFANINAHEFLYVTKYACDLYRNQKDVWDYLVKAGMNGDYSWRKSAREYIGLYSLITGIPYEDKEEKKEEPKVEVKAEVKAEAKAEPVKKPAAKKTPAKKTPAKKVAAKKETAAKKPAAKKTASKASASTKKSKDSSK